jgi:hypothetical protein
VRFPSPSGTICLNPVRQLVWRLVVLLPRVASVFRPGVVEMVMPGVTASELRHREASSLAACRAPLGGKERPPTQRRVGLPWLVDHVGLTKQQRPCRLYAGRGASNGGAAGDSDGDLPVASPDDWRESVAVLCVDFAKLHRGRLASSRQHTRCPSARLFSGNLRGVLAGGLRCASGILFRDFSPAGEGRSGLPKCDLRGFIFGSLAGVGADFLRVDAQ